MNTTRRTANRRPLVQLALSLLAAAALSACGGGGTDDATTGLVAAKSVASGTVTGTGTLVINGVQYSASGAVLVSDDGTSAACASDDCGLKLGMEAEVEAEDHRAAGTDDSPRAHAVRIHHGASLLGPVTSVSTDQWIVLGQKVNVTTTTVVDGTATAGTSIVEVHGLLNKATGEITATRIEVKSSAPLAYRLRGVVSEKGVAGAGTAKVGGQLVSFASLPAIYATLVDGEFIRTRLETATNSAGQWVAISVRSNERRLSRDDDRSHAELEGLIEAVTTTGGSVTAITVRGSTVTLPAGFANFEHGTAALLVVGQRVEVEGSVVDGALVPTKIEFRADRRRSEHRGRGSDDLGGGDDSGSGSDDSPSSIEYELHGVITNLDVTAKTFQVGSITFDYSSTAVVFPRGGSLADLMAWDTGSRRVEVKGYLMADGKTVQLVRVKLDDGR